MLKIKLPKNEYLLLNDKIDPPIMLLENNDDNPGKYQLLLRPDAHSNWMFLLPDNTHSECMEAINSILSAFQEQIINIDIS